MTALAERSPSVVESGDPTSGVRRVGSVAALLLAPWGFVVCNTAYALMIRTGGSDETGAGALALAAAHPRLVELCLQAGMIGCLLLVPAVLATLGLVRRSRLALVAGSAMIAGYTCYFGVLLTTFTVAAMAEHGGPVADFAAVIDASESRGSTAWVFGLFVLGNLVGTLLLAVALLRSGAVPRWAAVAIMLWPPLHVIGLIAGSEWFEVTGALLQAAGFAGIARVVWRQSSSAPALDARRT